MDWLELIKSFLELSNFLWIPFLLIVLILTAILRKRYKIYLSTRLFFAPWANMTNNKELDLGMSLSEILFFELESIQDIHKKSASFRGLWNEKSQVPLFEQSNDGSPSFLGRVEMLGATGPMGFIMRIAQFVIFFPKPMRLNGSIHKFGDLIRLQVTLEGIRGTDKKVMRSQCWKEEIENGDLSKIPDTVSDLAYSIYLTLADGSGCKSTESFKKLSIGLRYHLDYNSLTEKDIADTAISFYKDAIKEDGGKNALASYNLATIYYSRYTNTDNREAITYYRQALHTTNNLLRAQAYCGLANCYCQMVQRHNEGDESTLIDAIRFADSGYQIQGDRKIPTVAKALAYTWQVIYERKLELAGLQNEESKRKAIQLYREAIQLNDSYTIAYNNLGYLYLYLAKQELNEDEKEYLLSEAENHCKMAIQSDPTYHHAYDNLGNIYLEKCQYGLAQKYYYLALDYAPQYFAAFEDLSKLFVKLSVEEGKNGDGKTKIPYLTKALKYHLHALSVLDGHENKVKLTCSSFQKLFKAGDIHLLKECVKEEFPKVKCQCV